MAAPTLTPRQRQHLKAMAHALAPVVQLGAAGASDAVLEAIAAALYRHELIKVKLPKLGAGERDALAGELAERSAAALVQVLGRVVVLYADRGEDLPGKARIRP